MPRGENPADRPVRQITKTELAMKPKTAKTLGTADPATFDEVIE